MRVNAPQSRGIFFCCNMTQRLPRPGLLACARVVWDFQKFRSIAFAACLASQSRDERFPTPHGLADRILFETFIYLHFNRLYAMRSAGTSRAKWGGKSISYEK